MTTRGRKTAKASVAAETFEAVIDSLVFPLERGEVRQLLIMMAEESGVRAFDGEGLLRKYRRRTPKEIAHAVFVRLNETSCN
jgi:hypothetical protein